MQYALVLYRNGRRVMTREWQGGDSLQEEMAIEYMRAHECERVEIIDDATGDLKFSHPPEPATRA